MKGKKNSSKLLESKRQLLEAIMYGHNQRENPATRETQIVIITRTFRVLEDIWQNCGPEEVWNCIKSQGRRCRPPRKQST